MALHEDLKERSQPFPFVLSFFFLAFHYSASLHLPFILPSIMNRNSTTQGRNKVIIGKGYGFGKHIKEDSQRGKVYRMTKTRRAQQRMLDRYEEYV